MGPIGWDHTSRRAVGFIGVGSDKNALINNTPPIIDSALHGKFLNGALHWFVINDGRTFVCSFDLDDEQFQPFSAPSQFAEYDLISYKMGERMSAGVLKDHLFICLPLNNSVLEIWVLGDYDV